MRMNNIKPQSDVITDAKARLIARLKADGSVFACGKRKTNYYLKYESNNSEELERFRNDLKEVYGLEPKSELHRSGKKPEKLLKQIFIRSKLAFEDMQNYGPFTSKLWRIPNEIKHSNKEVQSEFLRIFSEDEGTVLIERKEVRIYSINKHGLIDLMEMFNNFGIETKINNGYGLKRNVYALVIKEKKNLLLFDKLIGFCSNGKKYKLKELINRLKVRQLSPSGDNFKNMLRL